MRQTVQVRVSREQTRRIAAITREAEQLKRELRDLVRAQRPELLAETGCGPLCAAILIGQTAGAQRFPSDAHFARTAGVAPIPVSSGRHERHRLDRGGNRQLNRALHVIAITRGRCAASSATLPATTTGYSSSHQQPARDSSLSRNPPSYPCPT
jgi:transposase